MGPTFSSILIGIAAILTAIAVIAYLIGYWFARGYWEARQRFPSNYDINVRTD